MRERIIERGTIFGIVVLLIITSIPSGSVGIKSIIPQQEIPPQHSVTPDISEKTPSVTFYTIGKHSMETQHLSFTPSEIQTLYDTYQDLIKEMTVNPKSENTMRLQEQFADLLLANNALSDTLTKDQLLTLFRAPSQQKKPLHSNPAPFQTKASEWFCNFVSTGTGSAFPIIILPRLIPFLLTPIPRAFVWWSTPEGITSVGGLISRTGFLAGGQQQGIAFGFWGIGFSIFLPPIMSYGLFGYALYTRVTAEVFEFYPPNTPPEITQTDPVDGQQMVPMSTTELRFAIHDADGETMSYDVTTAPDIGSASGGLKPNGIYSIPISGLQELTNYTWHISVNDGKDTVERILTFSTEAVSPVVSNPMPENGEQQVPTDMHELRFSLKDFQADAMDFTVETSPDVGSLTRTNIHDGIYIVPISNLTQENTYHWYVNVTDGTHFVKKTFSFVTGFPSFFNPFDYGWQYRKQITINHIQVTGELTNFQVLLSITDADLSQKTRENGDDLLFMNKTGVSTRLNYDIESFNHTTGTLIAWVNIPCVSSVENTTFYMYYRNPSCLPQQNPIKTWSDSYYLVYHMSDYSGSMIKDVTRNDNNGIKQGAPYPTESSGKIGKAQFFNGNIGSYISSTDNIAHGSNPWTYECWYKADSYGPSENPFPTDPYSIFFSIDTGSKTHYLVMSIALKNSKNRYRSNMDNQAVDGYSYTDNLIAFDNQWHHVVVIRNNTASELKIYVDGLPDYIVVSSIVSGYSINTGPLNIGAMPVYYPDRMYYEGFIDELRISNIIRSPQWTSTSFHNQNNPIEFLFIGPEEKGP